MSSAYYHTTGARVALREPHLLPRLAQVLRVDPSALKAMSHPIIDGNDRTKKIDFAGACVLTSDIEVRTRRVSPASLAIKPFHRTAWSHALIPYCRETGTLLIDRCPASDCGKPLGWTKTAGIDRCEHCGHDLKLARSETIEPEVRRQIDPVVSLVHPDPIYHGPAIAGLAAPLRQLNRGQIFELGWRLAILCGPVGTTLDSTERRDLPVGTLINRLCTMSQVLRDWPRGLHAQLGVTAASVGAPAMAARIKWFRSKARTGGLNAELEPFVREQLPEIVGVLHAFTAGLPYFPGLIGTFESSRMLKISSREFAILHRKGL